MICEIKSHLEFKRFKSCHLEQLSSAISEEELYLGSLPSSCILHIISFLKYDKVAQLRQVSKWFDETGKMVLSNGHRVAKKRLKREMERAKESESFPNLQRCPFRTSHFLKDIFDALRDCEILFRFYLEDDYHFVAGKVLDEAYRLLGNYNSRTTIPFVKGVVHHQGPHPLLHHFIQLTSEAYKHFDYVIVLTYLVSGGRNALYEFKSDKFLNLMEFKHKMCWDRMEKTEEMKDKIEEQERRVRIGEQTNRQFHDAILKLNVRVKSLNHDSLEMDRKLEQLANCARKSSIGGYCSLVESTRSSSLIKEPKKTFGTCTRIADGKILKLDTLPFDCLQRVLGYLSFEKVSQLRRVGKAFDETCKKVLNKGFENVKIKLEFCDDIKDNDDTYKPIYRFRFRPAYINLYKDLKILLFYCENTYKYYLGEKYYFSAGKVLERFYQIIILEEFFKDRNFNSTVQDRPHPYLFPLIAIVHKAIGHFRDNFMLKYRRRKCFPKCTPDILTFGDVVEVKGSFKKQILLTMKQMEKKINELQKTEKNVNEENRKSIKIISKLKKQVELLEQEVSEKRERSHLFPVEVNRNYELNFTHYLNKYNLN